MTVSIQTILRSSLPPGPQGYQGVQGVQGHQGNQGYQGFGYQGSQGHQGSHGNQGNQGYQGALNRWAVKTSNYTAVDGDRLIADTSAGSFSITLPSTPTAGDYVQISDGYDWSANNLTINRNGSTIDGYSDDLLVTISNITIELIYDGSTWEVTATTGARGPQGISGDKERRHDWVSPYSYCGTAEVGSSESASVWLITRIEISSDGTTTKTYAYNVAWTDRLTETYA